MSGWSNGVDRVTGGLNEDQRRQLGRLEQVKNPTGWQRAELAAIVITARDDDLRRATALRSAWGPS